MDLERFLVKNGFASEYTTVLTEAARSSAPHSTEWVIATHGTTPQRQIVFKTSGEYEIREGNPPVVIPQADPPDTSLFGEILVAELQRDKVRNMNALITNLRKSGANSSNVPPFIRDVITSIVTKVK